MPTLEAAIVSVEPKGQTGWTRIETDDGTHLDTKRPDLIAEARQLMRDGVVAIIEYNATSRYDEQTGRTYKNKFYEGAVAAGPAQQRPGAQRQAPAPEVGRSTPPADAWRICLAAGAKLAVATLPLMPQEQRDFETQKAIALAWAQFIIGTQQPPAQPSFYDAPPPDEEFGF